MVQMYLLVRSDVTYWQKESFMKIVPEIRLANKFAKTDFVSFFEEEKIPGTFIYDTNVPKYVRVVISKEWVLHNIHFVAHYFIVCTDQI